jgi:hypothetical protein
MSEEENQSVETEVSEAVAQPEESTDTQEAQQETQEERRSRNDAEYNWAEMRRQKREIELENAELKGQLNSLTKKAIPEEEEDLGFKDDDLIEGKHLKSLKKEINQLKQELKNKEASTVDDRLSLKFPDYKQTLTREKLEQLAINEPELSNSLLNTKDPYEQALLAYKYIKKFVPEKAETDSIEKRKAEANSKKPMSVQAVAKSSGISNANLFDGPLTQEKKNAIYKQMLEDMKGYG